MVAPDEASKVPTNTRQVALNRIADECLQLYDKSEDAFSRVRRFLPAGHFVKCQYYKICKVRVAIRHIVLHSGCIAQRLYYTVVVLNSGCIAQWLYCTAAVLRSDCIVQRLYCVVDVLCSGCIAQWMYCAVFVLHSGCIAQ